MLRNTLIKTDDTLDVSDISQKFKKEVIVIKKYGWLLIIVIILSVGFNVFLVTYIGKMKTEEAKYPNSLIFKNANSRDTIFSMHNIKKAQQITQGKGIKVGVIDKFFGYNKHSDLYSGGMDFSKSSNSFYEIDEHGYWMSLILKEIAPKADLYALNIEWEDENSKVESMIEAINWAIKNDIDVLTYSSSKFSEEYKQRLDNAVKRAIEHNIVTTFIHYSYGENILPDGFFEYKGATDYNRREPDINIYHFDYNVLFIKNYNVYNNGNSEEKEKYNPPYVSISSTSPVTAGFVALLKSINNNLKPSEYKNILRDTSKDINYDGEYCPRVADIYKAVQYISNSK